ncbi:DUF1481 domain-containing protein [Shigella flexneri]
MAQWRYRDAGEYRWQGDDARSWISMFQQTAGEYRARFDDRGDVSFMQRESDGEKRQLSNDQIIYTVIVLIESADWRCLTLGEIVLRQGRWHAMEQP